MAKNKWDVDTSDYDESKDLSAGGYDGDEPKKGIYDGRLALLNEHTTSGGDESLRWVFEITEEPYAGWRGYGYTNMESTMWKTEQFTNAIQGNKKGKISLKPGEEGDWEAGEKSPTVKKAKPVRLRIGSELYEGEKKARLKTVLPMEGGGKKKKDDDDDEGLFGDDDD
jgi:hypothetical protein